MYTSQNLLYRFFIKSETQFPIKVIEMKLRTFHLLQTKLLCESVWRYPQCSVGFIYQIIAPVEKSCQMWEFVWRILIGCMVQSLIDGQHAWDMASRTPRFVDRVAVVGRKGEEGRSDWKGWNHRLGTESGGDEWSNTQGLHTCVVKSGEWPEISEKVTLRARQEKLSIFVGRLAWIWWITCINYLWT